MLSSLGFIHYFVIAILMVVGLIILMNSSHIVKKIIGLNILQTSVFLFFISMGKIIDASAPILDVEAEKYSNPLPHVLILTAIVVGVATTAVGLALASKIRENYDTMDDEKLAEAFKND